MSQRHLLSTRRQVPLDRVDEYLAGWQRLRDAATERGVRAWLFRAANRDDHFLEFLECGDDLRGLDDAVVTGALEALDTFGPSHGEEWRQAL